jgi:hypothetical protein
MRSGSGLASASRGPTTDRPTVALENVLDVWEDWADDLRGAPIASGHHVAEEAPDALAAEPLAFLDASA